MQVDAAYCSINVFEDGVMSSTFGILTTLGVGDILTSDSGNMTYECGIIAFEGGMTHSEGGILTSERGILISEGDIVSSLGGILLRAAL